MTDYQPVFEVCYSCPHAASSPPEGDPELSCDPPAGECKAELPEGITA